MDMLAPRPEVHAALALAERHQATADHWALRGYPWTRRRHVAKHLSKAQKHAARAARLSGEAD